MKQLLGILFASSLLIACNNEKKTNTGTTGEAKAETPAVINYPYPAVFSANFSLGNPNHAKLVLDLYKMWEEGRVEDMKPFLSDSIFIDVYDGLKFNNTLDSCIKLMKQLRANYKSTKPVMETWIPVHHVESNEDFVLIWNRDYFTMADGKSDSLRVHAYFQIKDNKVRGWSEFQQKLSMTPAGK